MLLYIQLSNTRTQKVIFMLNQIINIRTSQEKKEKFRQIVEQDGQKISHVFQSFMSQVIKSGKLPKNLLKEGK